MTALPARADFVFSFAPPVVTAPDSRGFSNSTASGQLSIGTVMGGPSGYNFLDTWNFTLGVGADVSSFVGSLNFLDSSGTTTFGIDNLQLRLLGPEQVNVIGWQSSLDLAGVQQVFSIIALAPYAAGDYQLQVRGLLQGTASSYAGTLQAVNPVPVPASLPLLAGGLLVLATLARRRLSMRD